MDLIGAYQFEHWSDDFENLVGLQLILFEIFSACRKELVLIKAWSYLRGLHVIAVGAQYRWLLQMILSCPTVVRAAILLGLSYRGRLCQSQGTVQRSVLIIEA